MTETKKGELYIFTESIIWSFFPIITVLSINKIPILVSLSISLFFSILFFFFLLLYKNKLTEVYKVKALPDIFAGSLIVGIIFYVLYFFGLKYTSAGNANLVSHTEVVFSFILFHIIRKEEISKNHIIGIALMFLSALIVLSPSSLGFNKGDLLILLAAFTAPFGNFFQRRARKLVSSETIMFYRSIIAFFGVLVLSFAFKEVWNLSEIQSGIWYLLINGIVMFGIEKILWLEGIYRISIAKANALTITSPLLTLIFSSLILHQPILTKQLLAFIPMAFGLLFLTWKKSENQI